MRYPIAIEPRTNHSDYGVVIPDLPGCFSAGDTLEEAIAGAEDAGLAWIDEALDAAEPVPPPSSLEAIRSKPEYAGWILRSSPSIPPHSTIRSNVSTSRCRVGSCVASTTKRARRAKPVRAISPSWPSAADCSRPHRTSPPPRSRAPVSSPSAAHEGSDWLAGRGLVGRPGFNHAQGDPTSLRWLVDANAPRDKEDAGDFCRCRHLGENNHPDDRRRCRQQSEHEGESGARQPRHGELITDVGDDRR